MLLQSWLRLAHFCMEINNLMPQVVGEATAEWAKNAFWVEKRNIVQHVLLLRLMK
jgi:hypothetical protein